jgi:glutaconate CoA-transferase subunit A
MVDKLISLEESASLVRPGDTLALGGMTLYRRPVAFVRALVARQPRLVDLTVLSFAAGYETDLLIGAGMVLQLRSCYCGLEVFGLAPMFTQFANEGRIRIVEESEASLAFGMRAHLAGVSFMPGMAWLGTDFPRLRPDVKIIDDPYRPGEQVVAFPAIPWDVAVIHALKADRAGNALLNANVAVDLELAIGARDVVVTAEEIVEQFDSPIHVSGAVVRAVVHAPLGAWPTSCYPLYPLAGGEILRYIDACNSGQFDAYLRELESVSIAASDPPH